MKNFLTKNKKIINLLQAIIFIFFSVLIWNLAAKHPLLVPFHHSTLLLICEMCWAIQAYLMLTRKDGRYTLILGIIPIFLALIGKFPFILILATILIGTVNTFLRIKPMHLKNYYGLFCFSLVNASIPVTTINYLSRQYLEQATVLNVGILVTLYFLYYTLDFKTTLAAPLNFLFILIFAGLILANFPLDKDIFLIVLVLCSYGGQIFMRAEKITWCLGLFFIVSLIAFI